MTYMIKNEIETANSKITEVACEGKSSVIVNVNKVIGYINIIVCNASHAAYKKSGKIFMTKESAIAAYKSEYIKQIIQDIA